MKPLVLIGALALAAPALAQVVPDEFPDDGPLADDVRRELVERHRGVLAGLFATSAVSAGPVVGEPVLYGTVAADGGYRFRSGDAVALSFSGQAPLALDPLTGEPNGATSGSLGLEVTSALGRRLGRGGAFERFELGVGAGGRYVDARGAAAFVSVSPRIVLPLTPVLELPVGLRISQEVSGDIDRGPYFGLSIGLRRIWADRARMVLE